MAILVSQKQPVSGFGDLPISGNSLGDYRLVIDRGKQYYWSISGSSGSLADWIIVDDRHVTRLSELEDVRVADASPGQVLTYDSSGKWVGTPMPSVNLDGGSPSTDFSNGPFLDCGGVV